MNEPTIPKFTDPYKGREQTTRIQSNIDPVDYNFIRSIRPSNGTIITTVNILWSKLVTTLKQHGITQYSDVNKYEHFVLNCTLVLPDSVNGTAEKPSKRNKANTKQNSIS